MASQHGALDAMQTRHDGVSNVARRATLCLARKRERAESERDMLERNFAMIRTYDTFSTHELRVMRKVSLLLCRLASDAQQRRIHFYRAHVLMISRELNTR